MDKVALGYVKQAHGIRGQVHVVADGQSLSALGQVWLDEKPCKVVTVRPVPGGFLVSLEGINTRTQAEKLKGLTVYGKRTQLPPTDDDEYYIADLIGCAVYDLNQTFLGKVTATFHSGAQEVLEVEGAENFLLPFVSPIVNKVLTDEKKIICDPPEGLVTMNRSRTDDDL